LYETKLAAEWLKRYATPGWTSLASSLSPEHSNLVQIHVHAALYTLENPTMGFAVQLRGRNPESHQIKPIVNISAEDFRF